MPAEASLSTKNHHSSRLIQFSIEQKIKAKTRNQWAMCQSRSSALTKKALLKSGDVQWGWNSMDADLACCRARSFESRRGYRIAVSPSINNSYVFSLGYLTRISKHQDANFFVHSNFNRRNKTGDYSIATGPNVSTYNDHNHLIFIDSEYWFYRDFKNRYFSMKVPHGQQLNLAFIARCCTRWGYFTRWEEKEGKCA